MIYVFDLNWSSSEDSEFYIYRCATGFLSTADTTCSGNWGLKDQALAIEWVRKYAEHFGGDPSKIVLMGQSAGAVSVHLHMMSNYTKDKIFAAISLSKYNQEIIKQYFNTVVLTQFLQAGQRLTHGA